MKRIEVQYERIQQLKLLKDKYGYDIKPPTIPDYYDPNNTMENDAQKKRSFSINNKTKTIKVKTNRNKSISIHPKKSISSKDTNCDLKIKPIKIKSRKTLKF